MSQDSGLASARAPLAATALIALLTLAVGIAWNTKAAGGSDSYGYVSQAYAWLDGGIPIAEPLALGIRVHDAAWLAAPLGYRPGPRPGQIVPVYPPGLPLLMAAMIAVLGPGGAFLVAPLAGALTVWCTFLLGRRAGTPRIGVCAAALVATNPTFLYQLVQPMSDVPVTALWTACLVLACGTRPRAWIGAGVVAGVAILVRPNLAPLAAVAGVVGICAAIDNGRATRRSVAILLAAVGLPAAAAMGAILSLNAAWYGSAMASGYGTADQLFSSAYIWPNVLRYGRSLLETNPIVLPGAVLAGAALVSFGRARRPGLLLLALAAWSAVVVAQYLPYLSFPEWWYTRFLLPAAPTSIVLALLVLAHAASAWRVPRTAAGVTLAAALCAGVWIAHERGAFDLLHTEARFEDAGRLVERLLPAESVILAMQHSGSIRFYGHRPTLRWDALRAADLDTLVARFDRRGRPCYAVLDADERSRFDVRFAGTRTLEGGHLGRLFVTPYGVEVLALWPPAARAQD